MPDVYRSQQALMLSIAVEVSTGNQAHSINGCLADIDMFRLPLTGAGIAAAMCHLLLHLQCHFTWLLQCIHCCVCSFTCVWSTAVASTCGVNGTDCSLQTYVGASGDDRNGIAFNSGWMIQEINRFSVLSLYDNSKEDVSCQSCTLMMCKACEFALRKLLNQKAALRDSSMPEHLKEHRSNGFVYSTFIDGTSLLVQLTAAASSNSDAVIGETPTTSSSSTALVA